MNRAALGSQAVAGQRIGLLLAVTDGAVGTEPWREAPALLPTNRRPPGVQHSLLEFSILPLKISLHL